jgi:hypothetical protein
MTYCDFHAAFKHMRSSVVETDDSMFLIGLSLMLATTQPRGCENASDVDFKMFARRDHSPFPSST